MRLLWSTRRGQGDSPPRKPEEHENETVLSHVAPPASPSPSRLTSGEVTVLRVRALQGDPLRDVRDSTREWVFRSLLIGKHMEEWAALAGISEPYDIEHAVERVRHWYQQRLKHYHTTCH